MLKAMSSSIPDFTVSCQHRIVNVKVRVSANDESISDYCLTTIVGHNARPSRAVDKLCMVAATDAKLRDEDGGPIHPKQQHAHWTCRVLPKCKRNDVGDQESHTTTMTSPCLVKPLKIPRVTMNQLLLAT